MATYNFSRWEDGLGNVLGNTPSLTINISSDITLRAVYLETKRTVTYRSAPISVQATLNGSPINSNQTAQVPDGATITLVVPPVVTA